MTEIIIIDIEDKKVKGEIVRVSPEEIKVYILQPYKGLSLCLDRRSLDRRPDNSEKEITEDEKCRALKELYRICAFTLENLAPLSEKVDFYETAVCPFLKEINDINNTMSTKGIVLKPGKDRKLVSNKQTVSVLENRVRRLFEELVLIPFHLKSIDNREEFISFVKSEYKKGIGGLGWDGESVPMAPRGMEPYQFRIGDSFYMGDQEWRCTDIGTRTISAIKLDKMDESWYSGPPYCVAEYCLNEYDLEVCRPKENERFNAVWDKDDIRYSENVCEKGGDEE